jgi:hypothetical protein
MSFSARWLVLRAVSNIFDNRSIAIMLCKTPISPLVSRERSIRHPHGCILIALHSSTGLECAAALA